MSSDHEFQDKDAISAAKNGQEWAIERLIQKYQGLIRILARRLFCDWVSLEDLLQASPGEYLRRNLEGQYEIAQKYGALEEFYHVGGIIYTPNPIIVTVMTKFSFSIDELMGDAASMLVDYSLKLDERLEKLKAEPEVTATPEVQAVETPAPAETPAVEEPEIEEKGDSKTADTLVKLAAYISLPCFALAVILGLMQAAANARRKANRKRARARAEAQARSRSRRR